METSRGGGPSPVCTAFCRTLLAQCTAFFRNLVAKCTDIGRTLGDGDHLVQLFDVRTKPDQPQGQADDIPG